jgi:hypothetical protein
MHWHARHCFVRISTSFAVLTLGAAAITACDPVSTVTLGVVLNNLMTDVQETVARAGDTARGVVFDAGSEFTATLDNFSVAYDADLNKSIDALDGVTSRKLQEIESIVSKFSTQFDASSQSLATQAQQIVNTLPLASKSPQVRAFTPHFVASAQPRVDLRVTGNFPQAQQSGFAPSLTVGATTVSAAETTTQTLTFPLSPASLGAMHDNQITPATVELKVPYKPSIPLSRAKVGTFRLLIGTLPPSPGRFTLTRTVNQPTVETQHYIGPTYKQNSEDHQDKVGKPYKYSPDLGLWRVIPATAKFIVESHRGAEGRSWSWQWQSQQPSGVTVEVSTWWKVAYADGVVQFHVEFDEQRPMDNWQDQTTTIDLPWGGQQVYNVDPNRWKLSGILFDGTPFETAGSEDTRFLTVRVVGNTVIVKAKGPESVGIN